MIYLLWLEFLILLLLIFYSGDKVSVLGSRLANRIGITEGLIGVTLISVVTSLPELFTGFSAMSIVKDHDMLFGEILGSCIFNLTIVSIMSLFLKTENLFKVISDEFKNTAAFTGLLLLSVALFLKVEFFSIFFIGMPSIILIIFYFIIIKFVYCKEFITEEKNEKTDEDLFKLILKFSFFSLIIIFSGLYLPIIAKKIAIRMDWTSTFMGMFFIAMVTSLPELIVSFTAAKNKLFGIAVGNIFGSIIFNIMILGFLDFIYVTGTIWKESSWSNFLTAIIVALISFFTILYGRLKKNRIRDNLISLLIVLLYIFVVYISFIS